MKRLKGDAIKLELHLSLVSNYVARHSASHYILVHQDYE